MKILGEKSLSSKVIIGLIILFIFICIAEIVAIELTCKGIYHIYMMGNTKTNIFELVTFFVIDITGILALFIIYKFIQIFNKLKNNDLFNNDNVNRLNAISTSCFIMSLLYIVLASIDFLMIRENMANFLNYFLALLIAFSIIFLVIGIGIKILNEIYKKAIEYKKENDLVI